MRVLLLGATGNLGLRCTTALLAHKHVVVVYVRNVPKLQSLVSPAVIAALEAIVIGDATDAAGIKRAILEHDIDAIVDVAGTQVRPWQEYLLPKIARAVTEAAVAVGRERGRPLRAWITSGLGVLEHPGTKYLVQDFAPRFAGSQHAATRDVVEAVPLADLRWSLLCVAMMRPADPKQGVFELLDAPRHHDLLLKASAPPAWKNNWLINIPWIGGYFNGFITALREYQTEYEDVADFVAEDLEKGSEEWLGLKVGMKERAKAKEV